MSNYITYLTNQYANSYSYTKINPLFKSAPLVYGNRSTSAVTSTDGSYSNSSGISYLSKIQEGAKALQASLKDMTKLSTFQKMNAVSSNTDYLSVDSSSEATSRFQDTAIGIQQIATGQKNQGANLKSSDLYGGGLGRQLFEIEIDGKTTSLAVDVKAGDTNKDVQTKIAGAINEKGLGVSASVVSNKDGTSSLTVASKNIGNNDKNRFAIRDVGTGTAVYNTGVDTRAQDAQDAVFTVNGETRTSSTNTVSLGEGVKVNLKQATGGETVRVSVQQDSGYAVNKLQDIVKSYNQLLSAAKSGSGNDNLKNDLINTAKTYMATLGKFGFSVDADGYLSVNEKKLTAAAEDGSLQSHMTAYDEKNYGFLGRLQKIAGDVEKGSFRYTYQPSSAAESKTQFSLDDLQSANTIQGLAGSRSFNLPRYYQYESAYTLMGMFFNLYV